MEKKTVAITFRTTENTKEKLQAIANKYEWTISKLSEKIIFRFIDDQEKHVIQATIDDLMQVIMHTYNDSTEAAEFGIKLEHELYENFLIDR